LLPLIHIVNDRNATLDNNFGGQVSLAFLFFVSDVFFDIEVELIEYLHRARLPQKLSDGVHDALASLHLLLLILAVYTRISTWLASSVVSLQLPVENLRNGCIVNTLLVFGGARFIDLDESLCA